MVEVEPVGILHAIARFQRGVVEALEDSFGTSIEDPVFRTAYEAELGLPPGSLDGAAPPESPAGLHAFIDAEEAEFEQFASAVEDVVRYIQAWGAVLAAAAEEDTGRVVDELVYRLFELATLNHLKYRLPRMYWLMRTLGYVVVETRVHAFETLRYDNVSASFERGGQYFKDLVVNFVHGVALPDAPDPCPPEPEPPGTPPTADEETIADHTSQTLAFSSDGLFVLPAGLANFVPALGKHVKAIYGWEPAPGSPTPIADAVSNRAFTVAVAIEDDQDDPQIKTVSRAVATLLLHPDSDGGPGGWFASLRGDVKVDRKLGDKDEPDPWKLTARFFAPDGAELLGFDGFTVFGEPTLAVEVSLKREVGAGPAAVLEVLGTRLELGKLSFGVEVNAVKAGVKARAENSALVLVPKDGDAFLAKLLTSKELRLDFDLGLALDTVDRLHLEGGAGLTTTLAIGKSIGPVRVQTVQLGLAPGDGKLETRVLAALSVKLGAFTFGLDGIGFRFGLGFGERGAGVPDDGITLLPSVYMDGPPGFEPPNGVGVKVEAGLVSGGGFLFYDRGNRQYAGVLEVHFKRWTLKAVGLLTPAPPGATVGFSLLVIVMGEDLRWDIGLGITITGVGGLVGLNHGSDVEALRAGLKNRTLDSILFPEDPVRDAARIVANLRRVFPPVADQFLLGLMAKFEWPTPTLFTGELGLVMEFPTPTRLLILGQLHGLLPSPEFPPVKVHIDLFGVVDGDGLAADATLYDSSVIGFALTGDGALRLRGGADPVFMCSLGGFHPRFTPPAAFPRPDRLTVHFSEGDNLRMRAEAYLAVTSNTLQFGAKVDLYVGFAGFSLEGKLGFDALIQRQAPELIVLVEGSIAFKWRGLSLFGIHLTMTISGFRPWHFEGKVTFEVFGFSKSKSFDETCGEETPPRELPEIDPLPALVASLRDPQSWRSDLPAETEMLVALRRPPADGNVYVHPGGRVGVRQRIVPLDLDLDHVGGARLRGSRRFTLGQVTLDGRPAPEAKPATELFAAAQFLNLADSAKLSRPSFEPMAAGIELTSGGLAFGTADEAAVTDLDYETCILDADGRCAAHDAKPHRPTGILVALLAELGPAANAPLRRTGAGRYRVDGRALRLEGARFTVASVDDLTPAEPATFASYSAAWQAMRRDPADGLQVVGAFETEPAG